MAATLTSDELAARTDRVVAAAVGAGHWRTTPMAEDYFTPGTVSPEP